MRVRHDPDPSTPVHAATAACRRDRRPRRRFAGVSRASILTAAMLASLVPVAAPASASSRVLLRSGASIVAIAADGPVVAAALNSAITCQHVDEVNVTTGRVRTITSVRRGPTCDSDRGFLTSLPGPVLGLAGTRAAWVVYEQGNELYPSLVTAAPGVPERVVSGAPDEGVDPDTGPFLGPVAGSGSLLAYDAYDRSWLPDGCDPVEDQCTLSPPSGILFAIGGGRIGTGEGALLASVDSGRAAILRSGGTVAVVARDGHEVVSVRPPSTPQSAALQGGRLAVRSGATLLVYGLDGTLAGSFSIPGARGRVDLWGRTAVYGVGRRVMAIDVDAGTRRPLLTLPRGGRLVGVVIEGRVVSYAYNTRSGAVLTMHRIPRGA